VADFITSKIPRKVFEANKTRDNYLPSKDNPAPGHYDYANHNEKKNYNSSGNSAMFLSKVPNCNNVKSKSLDAPGPGYYEK